MKKLVQSWALGLVATSCFLSLGAQPTYQRYTPNQGGSTAFGVCLNPNTLNQAIMPQVGDFWNNSGNDQNAYYNMNPLCGGNIRMQYGLSNWYEEFHDGILYNDNEMAVTGQAYQAGGAHDLLFATIRPLFGSLITNLRIGSNVGAEVGNDIFVISANTYVIGGSTNSFSPGGDFDALVVEVVPGPAVGWSTRIGTSPGHDEVQTILEVAGRLYAIFNTSSMVAPGDPGDIGIAELDIVTGAVNWIAVAQHPGLQQVLAGDVDANGTYLGLTGLHRATTSLPSEAFFIQFDLGTVNFSDFSFFADPGNNVGRGITWCSSQNTWNIAGTTESPFGFGMTDGFIAAYDNSFPTANFIWANMYGTASNDILFDIEFDPSYQVFVCGGGVDLNNMFGTVNEWMLTTDDQGNVPCNLTAWGPARSDSPSNTTSPSNWSLVALTGVNHLVEHLCNYESDEVCSTPCKRSGISSPISGASFSVSPNPTAGVLEIALEGAWGQKGEIMDLSGVSVKKFEVAAGNFNLDISDLADGVYFLRLTDEGGHPHIQKVVKM